MEELKKWLENNLKYWEKENSIESFHIRKVLEETLKKIKKIEKNA